MVLISVRFRGCLHVMVVAMYDMCLFDSCLLFFFLFKRYVILSLEDCTSDVYGLPDSCFFVFFFVLLCRTHVTSDIARAHVLPLFIALMDNV